MKNLEEQVIFILTEKGLTIATAESCTGGAIAAELVNVSGASKVFNEGFITYSNEAKQKRLGVRVRTLNDFGAVSREMAFEMAKGVCEATKANVGIAITGIAGPSGGTTEKPVGTVYIGCCVNRATKVTENHFDGSRSEIRKQSVQAALELILECVEQV